VNQNRADSLKGEVCETTAKYVFLSGIDENCEVKVRTHQKNICGMVRYHDNKQYSNKFQVGYKTLYLAQQKAQSVECL